MLTRNFYNFFAFRIYIPSLHIHLNTMSTSGNLQGKSNQFGATVRSKAKYLPNNPLAYNVIL